MLPVPPSGFVTGIPLTKTKGLVGKSNYLKSIGDFITKL